VTFPSADRSLLQADDGLTLYAQPEDCRWGLRLLGAPELVVAQESYRGMHRRVPWPPSYVVVAQSLGDLDALVTDSARRTPDGTDCVVRDAAAEERPDQWDVAAHSMNSCLCGSLCEPVRHLVTVQPKAGRAAAVIVLACVMRIGPEVLGTPGI